MSEPTVELTIYDHRMRQGKFAIALHIGTVAAVVLAMIGVKAVVCALIPSLMVSIPSILWACRDLRDVRRRRAALEHLRCTCGWKIQPGINREDAIAIHVASFKKEKRER